MLCKFCNQDYPTEYYFVNRNPDFPCIYCAQNFALYGCDLHESLNNLNCVLNIDKWFAQLENQGIRLSPPVKRFVRNIHPLIANEKYVAVSVRQDAIIFKTNEVGLKSAVIISGGIFALLAYMLAIFPEYVYLILVLTLFPLFSIYFRFKEIKYAQKSVEVNFKRNEIFYMELKNPDHARVINFDEIKEFEKQNLADLYRPQLKGEIIAYLKNDIRIKLVEFSDSRLAEKVYEFFRQIIASF